MATVRRKSWLAPLATIGVLTGLIFLVLDLRQTEPVAIPEGEPVTPSELTDGLAYVGFLPDEIEWVEYPGEGGMKSVALVGDWSEAGPLVARYDIPPGMEVAPHTHRGARSYTVIEGVWELGLGEVFDTDKLVAYPRGSFYRLPPGIPHFQRAGPEGAVIQIESTGPDSFDLIE